MLVKMLALLEDPAGPEALEELYAQDRVAFSSALPLALAARPDALLLRAWTARLKHTPQPMSTLQARPESLREIWIMIAFAVFAGLYTKLPGLFPDTGLTMLTDDWFYPRNISLGALGAMLAYLLQARGWPRPGSMIVLVCYGLVGVYLNLLPEPGSDALYLAMAHGPLLLWCLICAAHAGAVWPGVESRREYIRFFGEVVVFSGLFFLGGGILVALTAGLFDLIGVSTDWVFEWMLPMGAAAIPAVAAWAALHRSEGARIMPLLARIFVPLFLVVLMGYLVRLATHVSELFTDRETLLIYNILLLAVLGLSVFSLSGRQKGARAGLVEWLLAALLCLTVLLDFLGLAAIGQRILAMGVTPNRLAVLGANLAVLGNLLWLVRGFAQLLRGRGDVDGVERITARYLPIYFGWTAFVTVLFPLVF